MKKSMLFLLLIALAACGKKEMREEYGPTVMAKLPPARVQDAHYSSEEVVSMADVNGKDIADVEAVETQNTLEPPPALRNRAVTHSVIPVIKKKIIKDGKLGLQVRNLEAAKKQIDSLVKKVGGYYANENLENNDNQSGYNLVIRIPVENFDKFVNSAETGNGKVLYKEISARDVTEEFVDLQTRLTSKRNSLARYNEIMKKANAVKDIVEIEQAIRVLQEEIESSEGRLRYLNDCVNYSTLNLTISTEKDFAYKPAKRDSFWEKFKESVVEGWFGLIDFILGMFNLWPFWLAVVGMYFLIRRWIKRLRAKRKQKNENA